MWNRWAWASPQSPCHRAAGSSGRWIETRPVRLWKWTFSYWSSRLSRALSPFSVQWWRILFVIYSTFTKIFYIFYCFLFLFFSLHYDNKVSLALSALWVSRWMCVGRRFLRKRGGGCCRKNMPNKCQYLSLFSLLFIQLQRVLSSSTTDTLWILRFSTVIAIQNYHTINIIIYGLESMAGGGCDMKWGRKTILFYPSTLVLASLSSLSFFLSGGCFFGWRKRNWKLCASFFSRSCHLFMSLEHWESKICKSFKSFFRKAKGKYILMT